MKRIVTSASGLTLTTESEMPQPKPHQSLIKVTAFSLNRGEIAMAASDGPGTSIGWDYVGTVTAAAADGSGPKLGTRVVGWRPESDAFAEYVIGETAFLAEIPHGITDTQAAVLPVAGLTALAAVDKGSRLVGSKVLVTGVTGGVGFFALQLAKIAGARVTALVRNSEQGTIAKSFGADSVIVSGDDAAVSASGPYRLIIDGVGGTALGSIMKNVVKGGTLVNYGSTGGNDSALTLWPDVFGGGGQRTLYGLTLYSEIELEPSSHGLARLLQLLSTGQLRLPDLIGAVWTETPRLAKELMERKFSGKAVLSIR